MRELAALVAASCLLALLMSWPLAAHLDSHIPEIGLGDPLLQAWQVAWGGHALVHQPLSFFQANTFWPSRDSLAFSDALLGYAPAGLVGSGARAALVRYNLLYLFAPALAFAGAFLLARALGVGVGGSAVAGAAFAYAPWRLAQNTHLHVISSGGIPLALFLLLHGYRRVRAGAILAGWLVATWHLSLGFTLGLQLAYLLAMLGAATAALWHRTRRPVLTGPVVRATAIGGSVFLLWAGVQAQPYLRVVEDQDEARRTVEQVAFYSPPPRGLLAVPENNVAWGDRTRAIRASLAWPGEQALFPGLATLLLAACGLASGARPRRLRLALAVAAGVAALLSFGFAGPGGEYLYGSLYAYAPGWQGIRTPGRITTLTSLALALLAAIGAQQVPRWLGRFAGGRRPIPAVLPLAGLLLAGIVLLEGFGPVRLASIPPVPAHQHGLAGPQLHLPSDASYDPLHMLWSTEAFVQVVNGHSGFTPEALARLRAATRTFPDAESVALLRSLGVGTVVVHPDLKAGNRPDPDERSYAKRLSFRWIDHDTTVVYTIPP
jgi:hypothetical protein